MHALLLFIVCCFSSLYRTKKIISFLFYICVLYVVISWLVQGVRKNSNSLVGATL